MVEITCEICGTVFQTRSTKAKYCSDGCRRAAWKSTKKRKRKCESYGAPKVSVDDVLRYAEEHRRKTGVLLSYGKAVAMLEARK